MERRTAAAAVVGTCVGVACAVAWAWAWAWARAALRRRRRRGAGALAAAVAAAEEEDNAVRDGFVGCVGETPLILLRSLSEATGCAVLGKAEFLNPGGSVKDRAARGLLEAALASGALAAGGTVVEGTVGSTGIALALQAAARGLRCRVLLPDDVAAEKAALLRAVGAEVRQLPAVSIVNPRHYVNAARAEGAAQACLFADQFESLHNYGAHRASTGPELLRQLRRAGLSLDALALGAGTGGTLAGIARTLREEGDGGARVFLADPQGSGLFHKVNAGVMYASEESEGTRRRHQTDSIVEGVGINRLTRNFLQGLDCIDEAFRCSDEEAVIMSRYLIRHEGLFLGTSSAVNCIGAVKAALRLGPGHTVVTVLCDGGGRYMSTFYCDRHLRARGLPTGAEAFDRAADLTFVEELGPPPTNRVAH